MLPTSASHHRTDITVRASRQEHRIEHTNGEGSTNIALAFRGHDCVYRKSKRSEEQRSPGNKNSRGVYASIVRFKVSIQKSIISSIPAINGYLK